MEVVNQILNDASVGKYDVAIGEGQHAETIKFANYMLMLELLEKNAPIPPEVIIKESMLSEDSKAQIIEAIEKARLAEQQALANQQGSKQ